MKSRLAIAILGLTAFASHADIYKSVDEDGHVTYSNIPAKGAKKLNIEPLTTLPKPHADSSGLKVDSQTQKMRDETRYRILSEELASEEGRLQESRQSYLGSGMDEAKARRAQEDIALHERNIEALKREISNMK